MPDAQQAITQSGISFPWAKYPGELHMPGGYNYLGPGSDLSKRLNEDETPKPGEEPIDRVDAAALAHDLRYYSKDKHERAFSDDLLLDQLNAIKNPTLKERLSRFIAGNIIRAKLFLGMGLEEPDRKELAKELHSRIVRKFRRMRVYIHGIDNTWGADIMFLPEDSGMKCCLTIIDGFSKYAWVVPLPNKKGATITEAYDKIIRTSKRKPQKLWTDSGSEFYNDLFKKYLEMKNIILYCTYNEGKCSIIERFNRTLQEMIRHKFTENDDEKWVKLLPSVLKAYNNREHRSIGMSPIEASKPENGAKVEKKLNYEVPNTTKAKFKVGDYVRLYK